MGVEAYPLQWPQGRPRRAARKEGRFGTSRQRGDYSWRSHSEITVAEALKRLQTEVDRIGGRYAVISTNLETRLDGLPRSGQREPADPGVALYFQLDGKAHCMPCDTYTKVAHNIAAIAAHIEATRAIERHGVASVSEMFAGFVALPPPKSPWDILGVRPGSSADDINRAWRAKAAAEFQKHYPEGYRMQFVPYDEVQATPKLMAAIRAGSSAEPSTPTQEASDGG